MTAPLKPDTDAVPAEVFLRAWLLGIVQTSPTGAGVGWELWKPKSAPLTPMPLPYRAVRRITGPQTIYTDTPTMHVHSFGRTYAEASTAGSATDDRMRVLMEHPGWGVTLSDGRVVHCDWVDIPDAAHHEPYSAESIVERFVTEVVLGLSFVPAP